MRCVRHLLPLVPISSISTVLRIDTHIRRNMSTAHGPVNLFHNLMVHRDPTVRKRSPSATGSVESFALIVLNSPQLDPTLVTRLWGLSSLRLCADGAARRLRDLNLSSGDVTGGAIPFCPDAVVGDMDSIDESTRRYYSDLGSSVLLSPDQDSTDLDKCLLHTRTQQELQLEMGALTRKYRVLVCGCLGGRFDHELGVLDALYRWHHYFSGIHLFDSRNMCTVLAPGRHLFLPIRSIDEGHCGLVPLGQIARQVTTSGLKWNLAESLLQLGVFVSVCNIIAPDSYIAPETIATAASGGGVLGADSCARDIGQGGVLIDTIDPLLWTNSIEL